MSKIDGLIRELCPNGVIHETLGIVCTIKTGQSVNKVDISNNPGEYPVINSGREPLGFIDKYNTENDPIGITTRGAGVGSITWCDGRYFRGNLNYSATIKKPTKLIVRFLYYVLMQDQVGIQQLATYEGIPALNKSNLEKLLIPIPPLEVQKEIVNILDKFTQLEAELSAELEARKKQYEYYRNQLLSHDDISLLQLKLGDVTTYSKSRISSSELDNENYVGVDNLLQNRQGKVNSSYVPSIGNMTRYESGDVLIGNIRPYLKKIWQSDRIGGTNGDVLVVHIKDEYRDRLTPRYLYHLLASDIFFAFNMQNAKGAKMPRGDKSSIMKFEIQMPTIEKQDQVVSILDKFDILVNDISSGLPAEIAARRKQYEYYRTKLLTFKEIA